MHYLKKEMYVNNSIIKQGENEFEARFNLFGIYKLTCSLKSWLNSSFIHYCLQDIWLEFYCRDDKEKPLYYYSLAK